jgi:hypothetical protein
MVNTFTMALPGSGNITLQQIQTEFGTSGLQASSTAAGLDPLPTSMKDFYGKSAFTPSLAAYTTIGTTNLTVPAGCTQIEMIIAAGGGSGGGIDTGIGANVNVHAGGGGGGGGVRTLTANVTAGQSITIVVGAGGDSGDATNNPDLWQSGSNSSVTIGGTTWTATGGIRGYYAVKLGNTGDGGSSGTPTPYGEGAMPGGDGFGYVGSGGGGGVGGPGGAAQAVDLTTSFGRVVGYGGDGGPSENFSVTGYNVWLGGGGAGGGEYSMGISETTAYAGGGDGHPGETAAGYGGRGCGQDGTQGGVVFYYK